MIYFDNAATSGKKPQKVINATYNALKNFNANPGRSGHILSQKTAEEIFKTREKISDFFNAEGPEMVVFTSNCTHSINAVLKGVLQKGEHIIVSNLEHNAVMRPLTKIGIPFSVAKVDFSNDNETVKNFEALIKPNTRMIFCTAASNVFGIVLPIAKIGALCRKRGIYFAVDAAQLAGVMPIDMQKMNIDFLCVASHKGLYAPMGSGILISRRHIENTIIEGGTGTNSLEFAQPSLLPERLESGTVNVPAILGTGAGIDFIKVMGIDTMYQKEMNLARRIYDGIAANKKCILYTGRPENAKFVPVISFNVEGMPSEEAAAMLSKNGVAVRGGYHCSPMAHKSMGTEIAGTVRISLSHFNTLAEVEQFLRILKQISVKKP